MIVCYRPYDWNVFMQIRKQLNEALEKQQKLEHERGETETKVMEVSVGESLTSRRSFILQSGMALFQGPLRTFQLCDWNAEEEFGKETSQAYMHLIHLSQAISTSPCLIASISKTVGEENQFIHVL